MPVIQPPATVLVTGASGFVGAWVIKALLGEGFNVRGTVRSAPKGDYLAKLFESYGDAFSYVIVADMTVEGAFDEAVKGIHGVVHLASPISVAAVDPDEIIKPAVKGVVNVLQSIKQFGTLVKRVVFTSSVAALLEPKSETPATYTEADWNTSFLEETKAKGVNAGPLTTYRASKVAAERAAWDFVEQNKGEIEFDLVALLPALLERPLMHDVPSPAQLNSSAKIVFGAVYGAAGLPQDVKVTAPGGNFVDVRDMATAHVRALQKEAAGGQRVICSAGPFSWQDLYNALNSAEPPLPNIPKGDPEAAPAHPILLRSDKTASILEMEFTGLQKMAVDGLKSLLERQAGWAAAAAQKA
ncbi:hypothetical protein BOTBODRAFT_171618 [Botryobasidium botryosum FD-172 SS1]|uniref:NAD-dependent epimerase/dehydratase domain-containing protein n=1 Tax=Botryobasidium botryosum (strain FD-172 SS1) TaxID=930990 RepID=A0A067N2D9_BOTB1|nr:hypothetical protein BOTBODRAFT_171618 [Botryobasidium botryosum FD-172 SS1]